MNKLVTGENAKLILDLGEQPVGHHFKPGAETEMPEHALKLGVGLNSGLVGLIDPPDWSELTPIYDWVKYTEAEDHLDFVAEQLLRATAKRKPKVLGVSYKDETLLARMASLGAEVDDLMALQFAAQSNIGVERAQAYVSELDLQHMPKYDLILVRHILEHTHDTHGFLQNISALLEDDGLVMFEVPDNSRAFAEGYHTIVWEEHTLYFTETSLKNLLAQHQLSSQTFWRFDMALEDLLVVVAKKSEQQQTYIECDNSSLQAFTEGFTAKKHFFQRFFQSATQAGQRIAILGAGHFCVAFINFYQLQDWVEVVLDDDSHKSGMHLPGTQIPIVSTEQLQYQRYPLCILTCNPWNDENIKNRFTEYQSDGGRFLSIFDTGAWV